MSGVSEMPARGRRGDHRDECGGADRRGDRQLLPGRADCQILACPGHSWAAGRAAARADVRLTRDRPFRVVLSVFAYIYWLLGSLRPASFNLPLSRVDALYFTVGTFTVLGWGFVAVLVALLVPRAAAARKRLSNGRIIVRTGSRD